VGGPSVEAIGESIRIRRSAPGGGLLGEVKSGSAAVVEFGSEGIVECVVLTGVCPSLDPLGRSDRRGWRASRDTTNEDCGSRLDRNRLPVDCQEARCRGSERTRTGSSFSCPDKYPTPTTILPSSAMARPDPPVHQPVSMTAWCKSPKSVVQTAEHAYEIHSWKFG